MLMKHYLADYLVRLCKTTLCKVRSAYRFIFHNGKKRMLFAGLFIGLCVVALCITLWTREKKHTDKPYSDLKTLQKNGRIRVGILQNTTDYYLDNGKIQGFQFELVELMAKHLGLKPHYTVYTTYWDIIFAILNNEIDLLAMNLNPNLTGKRFFRYTVPHSFSEHLLVQRKKDLYINDNLEINFGKDSSSIQKILLGVPAFSAFYHDALNLLYQLESEILELKVYPSFDVNDLFAMLNAKTIDVFIADAQTVKSNTLLYPALDYSVSLTKSLPQSWAVHKENFSLCYAIDEWMNGFVHSARYKQLVRKYFSNQSQNRQRIGRHHRMKILGSISSYDNVIKKYAEKRALDWRFVSAIIFQESKFDPTAIGWGGAYGLMQMMPITAQHYDIELDAPAEKQIADGCMHIYQLMQRYKEKYTKEDDLLKIVLMAYNSGSGNVDAIRKLTQEKGLNPDSWDDVEFVLRSEDNKPSIKGGSKIKTKLALKYVHEVWSHYAHYKNMTGE